MRPRGSKPGVLYRLCKVLRKSDDANGLTPFCPILSAIGTCLYNVANFSYQYLKNLTLTSILSKIRFIFK